MKILIVDDSRAMRLMVKRMISLAGFSGHDVIEAEDGVDAWTKIQEEAPGLVLSDWNMPNMTGMELLSKIAEEDVNLVFGFVTTEVSREMRDAATAAGAKFLIAKPFTEESFEKALGSYIE